MQQEQEQEQEQKRSLSSDCAPTVTAERPSLLGPPRVEQRGGLDGREGEGRRKRQ